MSKSLGIESSLHCDGKGEHYYKMARPTKKDPKIGKPVFSKGFCYMYAMLGSIDVGKQHRQIRAQTKAMSRQSSKLVVNFIASTIKCIC